MTKSKRIIAEQIVMMIKTMSICIIKMRMMMTTIIMMMPSQSHTKRLSHVKHHRHHPLTFRATASFGSSSMAALKCLTASLVMPNFRHT